ncbi:MAG: hypothetical protein QGG34_01260 [SAR202 cluster bacterium]|nr:hypothetical protein [SAR202 cluster bacterium]MDP6300424.1 hypothetical protein [SAR202 cluster bacterium]MDP7102416.1 hypothetical protein [SAR202 cluster bacterium]MDP7412072.1 hypothetical protein [SAR202 cluster bacterium]HJO83728.1 hypothetical protein [SAR202 cluster bacterium]
MEETAEEFAGNIQILNVYMREPHAGRKRFEQYSKHTSYEHKTGYACELVEDHGMKVPVLIDGYDEAIHKMFGGLPNMIYVIDKTGRVVYKSTWTMHEEVVKVLQELRAEGMADVSVPVGGDGD